MFYADNSAHGFQTVMHSIASWEELRHLDKKIRFHVALDSDTKLATSQELPSYIHVDIVPTSYKPQYARYKARALEYFRTHVQLDEDDWVLHLDEETQLDAYAIKAVLDFIERGDRLVGMVSWRRVYYSLVTEYC